MESTKSTDECGHAATRVKAIKHVERVGPYKVNDATGNARVCEACGDYTISCTQLERYELRAAATVLREVAHPDGAAIRYARKALGLKPTEFGALVGVAPEHVSGWESGAQPVTIAQRMAMVGYLEGVASGAVDLDWMLAQAQGTAPASQAMEFDVVPCGNPLGRRLR